jgi:rhodanese-related sulfurtransferase
MYDVPIITPKELEEKLRKGEKLNLVDVREEEEVAAGMIPGSRHIPMGEIPEKLNTFNSDEEYIFICRSGHRSGIVCAYLQDLGFKVRNLVGGILEWQGDIK